MSNVCRRPLTMSCLSSFGSGQTKDDRQCHINKAFPVAPVDSLQSDLDQLGPKVVSALLPFIGKGSRFCGLPLTFF